MTCKAGQTIKNDAASCGPPLPNSGVQHSLLMIEVGPTLRLHSQSLDLLKKPWSPQSAKQGFPLVIPKIPGPTPPWLLLPLHLFPSCFESSSASMVIPEVGAWWLIGFIMIYDLSKKNKWSLQDLQEHSPAGWPFLTCGSGTVMRSQFGSLALALCRDSPCPCRQGPSPSLRAT